MSHVGPSFDKRPQRGGRSYDDVYDTHRQHHTPVDKSRPHSPPNRRHDDDEQDETSSNGRPDSEASCTLKDRQDAINITHPFGLKIWKPALYKKTRSVQRTAEREIHSRPGHWPDQKFRIGNILWTLIFGWWMCVLTILVALILLVPMWFSSGGPYSSVLFGLAKYLLYPFGRFVELAPNEVYAAEDEGEGHSISEYERYGAVDLERGRQLGIFSSSMSGHQRRSVGRRWGKGIESGGEHGERDSLLSEEREQAMIGRGEDSGPRKKRRFFGRGQWTVGRILFFIGFYLVIAPMLLLVSAICWLSVFALPMAKVMTLLVSHLRRHPLSMIFHSDLRTAASLRSGTPPTQVLLCTYRAWGWEYYKYTIDGTNIFLFNLIFIVLFTIVDQYFLAPLFHLQYFFVHPAFIFSLALASIIPLSYFIGMAVASISAQSSMGMGAAINAFFGSVIEVYLYSIALTQGKSRLVEGSVVGNIFAGTLLMPGASMLFGALRRKTQYFNAKSAGVTSTMLLFSVICAFAPTILYQIYGYSQLRCSACEGGPWGEESCQRCYWEQANVLTDSFYVSSVKPFGYLCSVFLATSYIIGLWFSLRTHAAQIWETPLHGHDNSLQRSSSPLINWRNNNFDEPILKRIGRRMSSLFLRGEHPSTDRADRGKNTKDISSNPEGHLSSLESSLAPEDSAKFVRNIDDSEIATAAATVIVSDPQSPNMTSQAVQEIPPPISMVEPAPKSGYPQTLEAGIHPRDLDHGDTDLAEGGVVGGHDAPNWSRTKSSIILLGATILYAIIAEILVDTVDVVIGAGSVDEKFLGFTLFALVPSAIEFLNAISFALNENIALREVTLDAANSSMEIGSAYALQVCLLQVPALVTVSACFNAGKVESQESTFALIFAQWDLITVILCVFLLAYMYGEGKSNYFKVLPFGIHFQFFILRFNS